MILIQLHAALSWCLLYFVYFLSRVHYCLVSEGFESLNILFIITYFLGYWASVFIIVFSIYIVQIFRGMRNYQAYCRRKA